MVSLLKKIVGDTPERAAEKLRNQLVPRVNRLEDTIQNLSDEGLRAKTGEFRRRLDDGSSLDDLLPEAFAVVREAARRTLGQRHYDVQIVGGAVLHQGKIAEMKTGEGKDAGRNPTSLSQCADRLWRTRHHRQRLPGPP